jgi:hypothetical protein
MLSVELRMPPLIRSDILRRLVERMENPPEKNGMRNNWVNQHPVLAQQLFQPFWKKHTLSTANCHLAQARTKSAASAGHAVKAHPYTFTTQATTPSCYCFNRVDSFTGKYTKVVPCAQ